MESDAEKETIMFTVITLDAGSKCLVREPYFNHPVSVSDVCVGPEGEGFFSGFNQRKEGQQAEMSRDRPGTEEGGVCPA